MPGDLVVTEGEVGNSMYILLNGSADVYVSNQKEKSERSADAKMLGARPLTSINSALRLRKLSLSS